MRRYERVNIFSMGNGRQGEYEGIYDSLQKKFRFIRSEEQKGEQLCIKFHNGEEIVIDKNDIE